MPVERHEGPCTLVKDGEKHRLELGPDCQVAVHESVYLAALKHFEASKKSASPPKRGPGRPPKAKSEGTALSDSGSSTK